MRRKLIFRCLSCGDCCRNLLKEVDGNLNGLGLFPWERKLFPREMVSPQFGVGVMRKRGRLRPRRVVRYQLRVNVCPHLSEGNRCRMYESRPNACRSFPIEPTPPFGAVVSRECRFIGERTKGGEMVDIVAPEEWAASREFVKNMTEIFRECMPLTLEGLLSFDLQTRRWRMEEEDSLKCVAGNLGKMKGKSRHRIVR
ncbi:MAG: YkgJ family cysteine cluster protein [Candidatus Bathyarchaeia archaeon]